MIDDALIAAMMRNDLDRVYSGALCLAPASRPMEREAVISNSRIA